MPVDLRAQLPQRGISGSYKSGADAIIVSGKRCGCDSIDTLKYVAEWRIGANSLVMSFVNERPIRVFRSAKYIRTYNLGTTNGALDGGTSFYRYDGLYNIVGMHAPPSKNLFPFAHPLMTRETYIATHSVVYFLSVWSVLESYTRPPGALWVHLESPLQFFLAKIILRFHNEWALSRKKKCDCCNWRKNQSRREANKMVQRDWPQGRIMVRMFGRRFLWSSKRNQWYKINIFCCPLPLFKSCATLLLLGNESLIQVEKDV